MIAIAAPKADLDFQPPVLLRSPHIQTLVGSRGRGRWVQRRAASMLAAAERLTIRTADDTELEAWISRKDEDAPSVILIHGWLGHADSSYVRSAAASLWDAGFSVVRLNLRDHGNTAHLNRELFHSARIQEVVEAVAAIESRHATGPCGLTGFSLGGNFALRVARAHPMETVAVCPAMDPATTMHQIDNGWIGYRLFFVRKWHRALRAKQRAFPDHYRFEQALQLRSVSALTDLFVSEHTDYLSTAEYFKAYSLTGSALEGTRATVIYACDDPVIPAAGFHDLPDSLVLKAVARGGHCAFVDHPGRPAWIDRTLATHFSRALSTAPVQDLPFSPI